MSNDAQHVADGAITIERDVLPDGQVASETAREHIDYRWEQSSPLHRAAIAVVADWERRGISRVQAHLHSKDIHDKDTPYFAGRRSSYAFAPAARHRRPAPTPTRAACACGCSYASPRCVQLHGAARRATVRSAVLAR